MDFGQFCDWNDEKTMFFDIFLGVKTRIPSKNMGFCVIFSYFCVRLFSKTYFIRKRQGYYTRYFLWNSDFQNSCFFIKMRVFHEKNSICFYCIKLDYVYMISNILPFFFDIFFVIDTWILLKIVKSMGIARFSKWSNKEKWICCETHEN